VNNEEVAAAENDEVLLSSHLHDERMDQQAAEVYL
jgi:hypothetical protein